MVQRVQIVKRPRAPGQGFQEGNTLSVGNNGGGYKSVLTRRQNRFIAAAIEAAMAVRINRMNTLVAMVRRSRLPMFI
jgi:hypothetical protein